MYGRQSTHGAPCRTRTCGPMIKSHVLEPTQLKAHIEVRHFHNNYKQLPTLQIGQSAYSLVRLSENISVGYWRSLRLLLLHRAQISLHHRAKPPMFHCNYYGGIDGVRTHDLFLTKEVHYQLCYDAKNGWHIPRYISHSPNASLA